MEMQREEEIKERDRQTEKKNDVHRSVADRKPTEIHLLIYSFSKQ